MFDNLFVRAYIKSILVYLVNGETVSMFTIIGLVFILTTATIDIFTK